MIQINLLPPELRPRDDKLADIVRLLFYISPMILALLVIIHLYLGTLLMYRKFEYNSLNRKWAKLQPERQKIDLWRRKYRIGTKKADEINKLLEQRVTVSDKMQALVKALPNGIWFNQLMLSSRQFQIEGSVVSLSSEQMSLLNQFLNNLKNDKSFFDDFDSLELGRLSMRSLGGFTIMDFVLDGNLK